MSLLKKFLNQTRKPEGFLGKVMLATMNSGHAQMADWGMSYLESVPAERIIDLGCGAGRCAGELLKRYPAAYVTAIDHSSASVEKATDYNRAMIAAGRCTVQEGDVSVLNFPAGTFDLATAFETIYFWPGLERCFSQVAGVLKPGGGFLIVNESDGADAAGQKFETIIDGMKTHTAAEIETALRAAGFSGVTTLHHSTKPWIAVLAKK